jgi:hypothetical protein
MTHTPGPWTWEGAMNSDTIHIGPQQFFEFQGTKTPVPMQNGQQVATVRAMPPYPHCDDEQNRQAIANARLIAAAPDLLAALRFARQFVVKGYDATTPDLAKIDAAIAKAEGKD